MTTLLVSRMVRLRLDNEFMYNSRILPMHAKLQFRTKRQEIQHNISKYIIYINTIKHKVAIQNALLQCGVLFAVFSCILFSCYTFFVVILFLHFSLSYIFHSLFFLQKCKLKMKLNRK